MPFPKLVLYYEKQSCVLEEGEGAAGCIRMSHKGKLACFRK